ncbi:MAG: PT domain-containing protein [Oscillospiraceae bacterium]|nr:PT domain-containing protein [Oscillospiraceae bacterium]
MKKLFALVLALALLVPMGLIPVANAEGEVTVKPFYALGWSDFNNIKYPYLEGLLTTSFRNIGDKAILSYGDSSMIYSRYTDADVTKVAQAIKKDMDARPEGMRYWHLFGPLTIMKLAPQNVLFLDHAIVQLKDLTNAVLKKYKEIGGVLDGLVVDTEYVGMSSWYIYGGGKNQPNNFQDNKKVYWDIVNDPRYATRIRPLLVERGFPFWTDLTETTSEIYSICNYNKGAKYDLARSIWDTVIRIHLNTYVNEWCYEPLKTYFPEASLSDYQSHDSKPWLKLAAITDDGVALTGGNSIRAGTASSFSYYYSRPGISFFTEMQQFASFNDAHYEASAFNTFMYDINFTRHMYESSDYNQIAPWITSYVFRGKAADSMAYTPYYSELLFHLGMFDPEPFLSYTYTPEYSDENWIVTCEVMNSALAELTRVAGFSDRKPIAMPQYWNAEFVLSGMYANGRNIWRITPNTDEISLEDFKAEGTDPTFSVKGRTVTFPGGKIIKTGDVVTAGSCGYWVETAKDVTPIVTNDADRYAKYPSLLENFERYDEGKWDSTDAKPANTWEVNCSAIVPSASNIVSNAGGKALALNGDVTVRNVILPGKITAGDSYAEDQAWEITVTVPEGLSDKAEISLLMYAGSGLRTNDGGIKIAGGKVWYSELNQAGAKVEYKELADISAGTYTFRRVMNFNDSKNYTSTYTVLDAQGKEIQSVQAVAVPTFAGISAISFAVKGADKAVLLDDYKLYPNGLTADFELYDGATGMNVVGDSKNASRAGSTAYRLSWLNGTDAETKASVMAAIYENGTLKEKKVVKEVQMKPGSDGVETGVVDVAEGQHLLVYLQTAYEKEVEIPTADPYVAPTEPPAPGTTDPTAAPTQPTAAPTDPTAAPTQPTQGSDAPAKKGPSTAVIALIAVAVVAVVAVVLALVLTKKPAPKAEEKPEEKEN